MSEHQDKIHERELAAATLVFEHVKCLWDDQVDLAQTLMEKRKTISTTLAIVVGLGFFRVQFSQNANDVPSLQAEALLTVQILLTCAIVAIMCGAYLLFTQRPNVRRFLHWAWDLTRRFVLTMLRKARAPNQEDRDKVGMPAPKETPWPAGRALGASLPDEEELSDWFSQDSVSVMKTKTERLREAYKGLRTRNLRVSNRIRDAIIGLFLGYFLVFCALMVYLWSIQSKP